MELSEVLQLIADDTRDMSDAWRREFWQLSEAVRALEDAYRKNLKAVDGLIAVRKLAARIIIAQFGIIVMLLVLCCLPR